MKEISDVHEAACWAERVRAAGLSLGLVPTMGALHAGHSALIERARAECDRVVVSIFVNPTQFSPGDDLEGYPRSTAADVDICAGLSVDLVFHGKTSGPGGVYTPDFRTWVKVEGLCEPLCGRFRLGHFRGVTTVVSILLGIFRPHRAYFGRKDFQQNRLIEQLAADLHTGVEVRSLPTVRDADGLALSSRNRCLGEAERQFALAIPGALERAVDAFEKGEEQHVRLAERVREELEATPGLDVQYVEALDARTLQAPADGTISGSPDGVVLAVAALVGDVRLIDNAWLCRDTGDAGE